MLRRRYPSYLVLHSGTSSSEWPKFRVATIQDSEKSRRENGGWSVVTKFEKGCQG